MPIKEYFEQMKNKNNKRNDKKNERQLLIEKNELRNFFLTCPKAKYQFFPDFNDKFAKYINFNKSEEFPNYYILLGTGLSYDPFFNKNDIDYVSGSFALILHIDADKLQGNIFRIYNHIACKSKDLQCKIDKDMGIIGYIVKSGFGSNIDQAEADSVFVRAKRLASVVEKFTHSDATVDELEMLRIIYDNIYYIIMQEIQTQAKNASEEFKHNVNKAFAEDFKNNLPLNEFIEKWETWSEAKKTLLADYEGKILLEQLQRQQEQERQQAEQQKQKQKELYDYIKL